MLSFRRAILSDALPLSLLAEFSFRHTFCHDFLVSADLDDYCARTFAYPKLRQSRSNPDN